MGRSKTGIIRLLAFLTILVVLGAPASSAQEAGPQGRAGDAAGWRVAGTRELDIDGEPISLSLSPDGQWIAGLGPNHEFCVWDVAELDPVCTAAPYPILDWSITWSPGSAAVAFSADMAKDFDSDIFVFDVDTGSLSNLTDDGIDKLSPDPSRAESGPVPVDINPAWSLDGTELTFARSDWAARPATTTLMTIPAAGGEPVELLELETVGELAVFHPMRWLENGSLLYTIATVNRGETHDGLWSYEPGGEPIRLLHGTSTGYYPDPLATDVYERNGKTVVLGYSPLVLGHARGLAFALDLETGATISLEETLSIDNADAAPGDETFIFAPPRISPDGSAILLGIHQMEIHQSGARSLAIAPVDMSEAPVAIAIDVEIERYGSWVLWGFTWATNNTVLVPTVDGPAVLLTLERSTPAMP